MKKVFVLLVLITLFNVYIAYTKFSDELLNPPTGHEYRSHIRITAPKYQQAKVLDILTSSLDDYGLNATSTVQSEEKVTVYMYITDTSYQKRIILESGESVGNLNTRSFYYSNYSDDASSRIFLPSTDIQYEYMALSEDIFQNDVAYIVISSRIGNMGNEIGYIRDRVTFNHLSNIRVTTSDYELYGNESAKEIDTLSKAIGIVVLFLSCVFMHTKIKRNRNKIMIHRLEGYSFFDILMKNIVLPLLGSIAVCIAMITIITAVLIPLNIVFYGNATTYVSHLLINSLIPFIGCLLYTVYIGLLIRDISMKDLTS